MALLLLRISVAAFLFMIAINYDVSSHRPFAAIVLMILMSLLIGFLTPLLCAIAAALVVANMIINPQTSIVVCIIAIANVIALGLLGPGAYSLDSKLFGRRVTVVRSGNRVNHLL